MPPPPSSSPFLAEEFSQVEYVSVGAKNVAQKSGYTRNVEIRKIRQPRKCR